MVHIRFEKKDDYQTVESLNDAAFQGTAESKLIAKLRISCPDIVSLVSVEDDRITGHILFSPVSIVTSSAEIQGMGLGPMAVLPEFQKRGIGSKLIKEGLGILLSKKCPFVIVLGHADYYPKFGFVKASKYGIKCQWEGVPDEVFMILFFNEALKKKLGGIAYYPTEYNDAM